MVTIMSQSSLTLNCTARESVMDVTQSFHYRCHWYKSKVHQRMQSSSRNSSHGTMSNDTCDGAFLPKGAVNLLGPTTYAQVLKDNNLFLTQVATIPVNLKHNVWFAIIDPNVTSDDAPISLHDHLM